MRDSFAASQQAQGISVFEWNFLSVLALLLACASGYFLLQSWFRGPSKGIEERMQEFANQAVQLAKAEYEAELDFSIDSLKHVEKILLKLHAQHQVNAIPERELSRIVLTWGAYIGVVLQRKFGGTWRSDSPKVGLNTFPLQWKDDEAVPVMWCLQQIRNGTTSSIVSKMNATITRLSPN